MREQSFERPASVYSHWGMTFVACLLLCSQAVAAERRALSLYQFDALQAKPIPAQIPGQHEPYPGRLHASFWINGQAEIGTLDFDIDPIRLDNLSLRCAAAGSEGPEVWAPSGAMTRFGRQYELRNEDLIPHEANDVCPMRINNLMSLYAAGARRLLYVEFDFKGRRHRGQLWNRRPKLTDGWFTSWANLSDQQLYVEAPPVPENIRHYASLSFQELTGDLDTARYTRYRFSSRVEIRCALPGTSGPVVAVLEPGPGFISSRDLQPTMGDESCGVEITTIAGLLEALLRGRLYVVDYGEDGQTLSRGQFLTPDLVQ